MAYKRGDLSRFERQLKLMLLLHQAVRPMTVDELASDLGVSKRTVYRDLKALESTHLVPITGDGGRRIAEGHFLPPIRFALPEVTTIFLAARLMLAYSRKRDPNIVTAFSKLNAVVPPALREEIRKTMEWLKSQPADEGYLHTMATLAEAWATRRRVRICYHALDAEEATERDIDPYFIEPAAAGHSTYVIALCHRHDEIRMFKVERITDIRMTTETYEVPDDFDANEFLAPAMGILVTEDVETVRLRFSREVARFARETIWHPSQTVERQNDGSAIVTLRVANTIELRAWVMGWGEKVAVLEPESLRHAVIESAQAMLDLYGASQCTSSGQLRLGL
ncbi:MAG: transcriptional regulator [Chloroflexota bacterium]|nr:transcriptional regulator [Chloroflexota bacterium]